MERCPKIPRRLTPLTWVSHHEPRQVDWGRPLSKLPIPYFCNDCISLAVTTYHDLSRPITTYHDLSLALSTATGASFFFSLFVCIVNRRSHSLTHFIVPLLSWPKHHPSCPQVLFQQALRPHQNKSHLFLVDRQRALQGSAVAKPKVTMVCLRATR